ncbi:hypothetical protein P171DRAFT_483450 [Karstenula rhodostoma CBS 690.94]|uniref:Uncharacterized protein n=1 Tax=Karstenula rhodostoma CBS 690.94 TaxID=1392251 RepID=A0A9P4PKW5_9PLEO|nr:hypothetical protein P171DRAFT_483450 [Karstenula rhodostoma CBS 690.94]
MLPTMDSIRKLLPMRSQRAHETDPKYEPLHAAQTNHCESCLCNRCNNPPSTYPARLRLALQVTISLVVLALWTALVGFYLARNPHLLQQHYVPKNLADLFPIVPTDFQPDTRFTDSDPYDSPFWTPYQGLSDDMASTAWNYYGSMPSPAPF